MPSSRQRLSVSWRQDSAVAGSLQGCTPAVGDEHVYVADMSGILYSLSRADGETVWRHEREGTLSDSSPYLHDGTVYVGSGGGTVYAVDTADGSTQWQHSGPSAVTASPVVDQQTLYVGRNDGELLALDKSDGSLRWQTTVGAPIYSDLACSSSHDRVVVGTSDGTVCAYDTTDGRQCWSQSVGADVGASSPVVDESRGLVYYAADELVAVDLDEGTTAWGTTFYGANAGSAPAFDSEYVYLAGGDGSVSAISRPNDVLATAPDWKVRTWNVSISADLAIADNKIYFTTVDGDMYVLYTETGEEYGHLSLPCETLTSAVVAGKHVYVAGRDGTVFAVTVR